MAYMFNGQRCEIAETIHKYGPGMVNMNQFRLRYEDGREELISVHDFDGQLLNTNKQLADFEAAVLSPDFSHVSYRRSVRQNVLHVYRRDRESPSGCIKSGGAMDDDAARAILAKHGKRAQQGGLMGEMAARQMMTGVA